MFDGGLFITLSDEDSLRLYLNQGVYGTLLKPVDEGIKPHTSHYGALADFCCARAGTHVFFFLNRNIIYGGRVGGSSNCGAFYLNGLQSGWGRKLNSPLAWDESKRSDYITTGKPGQFKVKIQNEFVSKNQPYLIKFADYKNLRGKQIASDELYFELGQYHFPLPSNGIQGMSFCTMTPVETSICLDLMKSSDDCFEFDQDAEGCWVGTPTPFSKKVVQNNLGELFANSYFHSEAHLEATLLAKPSLFPKILRPKSSWVLCRQIPICPFKPYGMDRADICFYDPDRPIEQGALPNTIIELKHKRTNNTAIVQAARYLKWLQLIADNNLDHINIFILAPSFTRTVDRDNIPEHIQLIAFAEE